MEYQFKETLARGSFPGGSDSKESACNVGDLRSIHGLGRPPGERNSHSLQYSCLKNPMDRRAWWAPVRGVAKSRTRLSDFHLYFSARRKTSEQAVFVIQERDIGGPDEGCGMEGSEWIGELTGGRIGARGNWLNNGRELSQEFWLPHLLSGQDCPGCSSGGESCLRIIVCVAWNGPLVHGCPRSIIQDYAQLHVKESAVPQTR